ncbi:MAG TPA: hypothetical protein VFQ37_08690 [Mycobacterium sp.]|nr:hypothetical protein [Mycobacterium sp.]
MSQKALLLEVDARRRLNLSKVGHHDRYTAVEHDDGTIVLTPALILNPAELHYVTDTDIQALVATARANSSQHRGKTRT